MAIAFSAGVDAIVQAIHPYSQKEGHRWFPPKWEPEAGKQGGNEPLLDWYRRCVDTYFGKSPNRYAIEENFASFVSVRWVEETKLTYVSAQAIIVRNKTLKSYYANGSDEVQYLRLDYHGARIGAMFKEHWPHVHIAEDGEPRFPSDYSTTGNIVIDFFDFIYRNYYHSKWIDWAELIYDDYASKLGVSPNPFPAIRQAFDAHQIPLLLGKYRPYLEQMKRAWRENNDSLLPLFISNENCRLLSYTV